MSLTVIGLGLLLEASARIFLFGMAGLHPCKIDSVQPIWESGLLRRSEHRELGYELRPNVDGYFKLVRFRTNSRGLRDREYAIEKSPNTFRVAVLGSSFALPSGVEIEEAFHSVLEQRLAGDRSPVSYEFINFSVGAYGPRQVLAMLQLRAMAYEPDLVLFTVTKLSMPLLRSAWDRPLPPHIDLEPRHAFCESFFFELLKVRLGQTQVDIRQPQRPIGRERITSVIDKLGDFSRTTGVPVVVIRLEHHDEPPSRLDVLVEEAIRAHGLYFLDTREAFGGTTAHDFYISELDPHPNAAAHAIFADVIAKFLRVNGWIRP